MSAPIDKSIAYTVTGETYLGPYTTESFAIKASANAWWMDRGKVYALLFSFKLGTGVKAACAFAMITIDQYKYFCKVHPEFSLIKERIEVEQTVKALFLLNKSIDDPSVKMTTRLRIARWMLERLQPAKWGSSAERLFWAKQALHMRGDDEDIVGHFNDNVELARELIRSGNTVFFQG